MNANMKFSDQCRIAASKGNQVLGMIRRNITYKENSLIVPLYKAIVRSHVEYCMQAWSQYLRKDIYMLEKIQMIATKLISVLPCSAIIDSSVLYSTLLYSTLLYSTLLYSTLLYSTLLVLKTVMSTCSAVINLFFSANNRSH